MYDKLELLKIEPVKSVLDISAPDKSIFFKFNCGPTILLINFLYLILGKLIIILNLLYY